MPRPRGLSLRPGLPLKHVHNDLVPNTQVGTSVRMCHTGHCFACIVLGISGCTVLHDFDLTSGSA